MAEWLDIRNWADCERLARPGIIFEVQNSAGQSLFTECRLPLPPRAPDWTGPPVRFRAIEQPKPERSEPIPPPR